MTVQELNNRLTSLLQEYIKSQGHVKTGRMLNSVRFACTYTDLDINIVLDAVDYIYDVENGAFMERFYALDTVSSAFVEFLDQELPDVLEREIVK